MPPSAAGHNSSSGPCERAARRDQYAEGSARREYSGRELGRAAVFYYYAEEEALTWDHSAQAAALRELGVSSVLLDSETYPPGPTVEPRLRDFFSTLRS